MLLPCRVVRRIEIAHFSDRHFWNGGYDKASPLWSIPADNRRLVERTTHPAHLAAIEAELASHDASTWSRHIQGKEGATSAELGAAEIARLDWRTPFEAFRIDPDEHAMTRLGTADQQVDLQGTPGPFGFPVTVLRVPHFLLDGVPPEAEPTEIHQDAGSVRFRLGAGVFHYGRFGLERERG